MSELKNEDQNSKHCFVTFQLINNVRFIAFSCLDVDKRQIQVGEFEDNEHFSNFESMIFQINPQDSHVNFHLNILYPEFKTEIEKIQDILTNCAGMAITEKEKKDLVEKFYEQDLETILLRPLSQYTKEQTMTKSLICLASLVKSLNLLKDTSNNQQFSLKTFYLNKYMKLDLAAINALSIFPKNLNEMKKNIQAVETSSLIQLLDKCKTQIGSRLLKLWIKQPLQNIDGINERLNKVQFLADSDELRQFLCENFFKKIADLDKLYPKFYKVASRRKNHGCTLADCLKAYQLIKTLYSLNDFIIQNPINNQQKQGFLERSIQQPLSDCLESFERFEALVEKCINLDKAKTNHNFEVNPQYSPALLKLSQDIEQCKVQINEIKESCEKELGVRIQLTESNTHTYLFEGKKQETDESFRQLGKKGRSYKVISVKKNLLSFTTQELQTQISELNSFNEQYQEKQVEVIDKILQVVATYYPAMEDAAAFISELDVLCAFANVSLSSKKQWMRPVVGVGNTYIFEQSRHPILDAQLESNQVKECIENDCELNKDKSRLHIITGPNMGGKSTYIRQVAICTLLAHIGCFVPASKAMIPVIDAIVTRVGASDMQLKGISTFMSEMLEASCMLQTATSNSLVIMDELGRGTSTSEGFGLAWAISEYLAKNVQCYCLFATHFHELTKMENEIVGVKNYHVTCLTKGGKFEMQYKIRQGFAERSYGLYVAEILSFPESIMMDAAQKLKELEKFTQFDMEQEESEEIATRKVKLESVNDIGELSKLATLQQKELIVNQVKEFQLKMKKQNNEKIKQSALDDLKNAVRGILKGNC